MSSAGQLPPESLDFMKSLAALQSKLRSVDSSLINAILGDINSLGLCNSIDGIITLLHELTCTLAIRPHSLDFITEIVRRAFPSSSKLYSSFISLYLQTDPSLFAEESSAILHIFRSLFTAGVLSFEQLEGFVTSALSAKRQDDIELMFLFFSVQIQSQNPQLFERLFESISKGAYSKLSVNFDFPQNLPLFDPILFQKVTHIGYIAEPFGMIFYNDDVKALAQLISNDDFNFDVEIHPGLIQPWDMLHSKTSLLHIAAFFAAEKCFSLLLESGGDVRAMDEEGNSVMTLAIAGGNAKIISDSFEYGAEIKESFNTAYFYDNTSVIPVLQKLEKQPHKSERKKWADLLNISVGSNNLSLLSECINHGVNLNAISNDMTPLSFATFNGHEDVVKILLSSEKINANSTEDNMTPLQTAIKFGRLRIVIMLLSTGKVDPNLAMNDETHSSPVHLSIEENNIGILKSLLECKSIDMNAKNSSAETPLILSAKLGFDEGFQLLLSKDGVNLIQKDQSGVDFKKIMMPSTMDWISYPMLQLICYLQSR